MLSLTYVSSATRLFSEQELIQLLKESRARNTHWDISGMLLYKDGNFMQVFEGPDEAVRQLYDNITKDPRHRDVILLREEAIDERQFPDWSMGFRNLADADLRDVPGYSDFLNEPLDSPSFQASPTRAQKLLLMFRRQM